MGYTRGRLKMLRILAFIACLTGLVVGYPSGLHQAALVQTAADTTTPPPPPALESNTTAPSNANNTTLVATTVPDLVATPTGASRPDARILIAVVSAPLHEDARRAIRNTWARLTEHQKLRVDVRFFVGIIPDTVATRERLDASL